MKKILSGKWKYLTLLIYAAICFLSLLLMLQVKINYDLSKYLPGDSITKKAIDITKNEFGYPNVIEIMVDDVDVQTALKVKDILLNIDGIESVLWLDDVVDVTQPVEMINQTYLEQFYQEGCPLYTVELVSDSYDLKSEEIVNVIRSLLTDYSIHIRGETIDNIELRTITNNEISSVIIVILPICIFILLLASTSYLEPLLILLNLGVAIIINMGTNIFLGEISNITLSMSSVLLLAISMDYSIFLIHRYYEKRDQGLERIDAISESVKDTVSSISASALTTVMGFVALFFMRYTIGIDIGIVLAKGVVISFVTSITLLPVLLYFFAPLVEKTKHKVLLPKLGFLTKYVHKFRYVIVGILILLAGFSYFFQSQVLYNYGSNQASDESSIVTIDNKAIESKYGINNPIVILIPNNNVAKEVQLANDLQNYEHINKVQTLVTLVDHTIPRSALPSSVLSQFVSDNYVRYIVNVPIKEESELMYEVSDTIEEIVASYFDEYYLAGIITSTNDIKKTIIDDSTAVTWFSILAIGLVILVIYRSLPLPILLIAVIETSIWVNMAVPYFQEIRLAYIGYLICSSLQLGATIDYAVLFASRYLEFRKDNAVLESIRLTLDNSSASVIVSALVLTVAGFSLGIISDVTAVSDIGLLLGRGALLSGILVLLALPSILILFDKWIIKLTLNFKRSESNESESQ